MKIYYCVIEDCSEDEKFDTNHYTIDSDWSENEGHDLSEECAEDYYDNHDGWEIGCKWPLTFRLWQEDGCLLGDYSVELESTPVFNSRKIKNEKRT